MYLVTDTLVGTTYPARTESDVRQAIEQIVDGDEDIPEETVDLLMGELAGVNDPPTGLPILDDYAGVFIGWMDEA